MPELPEVETIKNELVPWVVGQSFTKVTISDAKVVCGCSAKEIRRGLIGPKIEELERRGKYLIFHLSNGRSLIIHLRMTGSLLLDSGEDTRYARALFHLSNGHRLVFSDRRRLGKMWLVDDAHTVVCKLGPEPLDKRFTPRILRQRLSRHHIPIKAALLDQCIVAGIGNMYADEALFAARIHPLRKADHLLPAEVRTLHNNIRRVLRTAIDSKGASVDTYIRPQGELGTAHFDFMVAHRGGEPCPVCGGAIERCVVQNRGTYFCPRCQPLHHRPLT
ncbi:MAG: bifunctional DNA-formamidopyrimidine glycosylase/DNA-(apurinic or apyrimidinic site) lyase [Dehalococcoidia bacterium]|nr:bifunctional DNA-formamidopyrimidine glycosylase/DNA-(apurinic or apyrimidinic site) lyase [Dehalococcoidia bacterium]MDH4299021.1 bifunctional DNA-formamidopyrimidine glycosylase/DNA-(apurinic or apyrimidinic site) lyase [Dehalococcoidia bacterium]MDH4367922.1 bifunctional DNA-formamidopyrimidine glycosylase/DNA-(apurinic or apyrimidinic site) lyase [Dehalococcoidia bacterium]